MAKQLNVNLAFNAETAQAKRAIEDLSQSLRKIQAQPSRMFDDTNLKKASQAAQDLEKHLQAAVNVNTGKLDLNKFSQSLASAKQSLGDLYKDLSLAGSQGQAAFLNLAKSINAADSSSLNLGSKLKELTTTLKNTARWEISSKIMHGFESMISSAYGYAQDLNRSLNDIRIVTGANADEMARFAESANKAARQLSTTTTDYTNASLIYFQQGLSDAEVAERTEVTIKMANAAGVSAEKVSDQMTAVWNNFDNGSKSLEYYADVMTALGAATASSTDEISQGLNKFAAVAETVGLSYEYAAAALATVTSETRESADVVGTAYKTLFARIQGLQQGDTLEDGTTLNKYSEALAKVGISIKDTNGNMKEMDTILNEMGSKWGTLAKDQQLALAQTVAGVRQYTQLVALMENWGTFQENLNVAYTSEGTLQEQADIYAESWEAASNRVRAAAEGIYEELLNDDFFIDILNGFEGFLTGINNVIDGVGGLKTILLSVGGIILKQYSKEIPKALSAIGDNFDVITGKAEKKRIAMLEENKKALSEPKLISKDEALMRELQAMQQVNAMTIELEKNRKNLSEAEIQSYQHNINMVKIYGDTTVALAKEQKELEKKLNTQKKLAVSGAMSQSKIPEKLATANEKVMKLNEQIAIEKSLKRQTELKKQLAKAEREQAQAKQQYESRKKNVSTAVDDYAKQLKQQSQLIALQDDLTAATKKWAAATKNVGDNSEKMKDYEEQLKKYLQSIKEAKNIEISSESFKKLSQELAEAGDNAQEVYEIFSKFKIQIVGEEDLITIKQLDDRLVEIEGDLRNLNVPDDVIEEIRQLAEAAENAGLELEEIKRRMAGLGEGGVQHVMATSEALGVMASTAMELWSVIEALKNLGSIWSNDDLTTGEKLFQTMSAMLPIFITLTQLTSEQNKKQLASAGASLAQAMGLTAVAGASGAATVATTGLTGAIGKLYIALGPIGFVLAAIVAAMALIAVAFVGLSAIFNAIKNSTPEAKFEKVKAATDGMADAAEKAQNKYQNLLDTITNYDSAVEALDDLTAGTNEFTSALLTANGYAQDLIDKYNLMPDDYSIGDNGLIQFKSGVLDNAVERERETVENSNALLMGAKIAENNGQRDMDAREMGQEGHGWSHFGQDEYGTEVVLDEYQVAEIYQRILKAGYKNVADFNANANEETKQDIIKRGIYGDEAVDNDWINWDQLNAVKTISENFSSGMANYEKLYVDNEIANEGLIKQNVINSLSDELAYQNSQYKDFIIDQIATNENYEAEKQNKIKNYEGKSDEEIESAFEKALGDNYIYEDGKVYNKDEKGNKGEENTELTGLSIDQKKDFLASGDAIQALEEKGVALANKVNSITTNLSEEDQKIAKAFMSGGTASLSKKDIEKLQGVESFDDLVKLYPELSSLEALGPEVINTLFQDFSAGIESWEPPKVDLNSAVSEFSDVQKIISDIQFGDIISEEEFQKLGNEADAYFTKMADGTYKMTGDAEELYNVISSKNREELINTISANMDYGNELQSKKEAADKAMGSMNLDTIGQSQYNEESNSYNASNVKDQINFATEMGTMSQEEASGYLKDLEDGAFEAGAAGLQGIAEAADLAATKYRELTAEIDSNTASTETGIQAAYTSANSLSELNSIHEEILQTFGDTVDTSDQYAAGLINLGSKYSNCTDEIQDYQKVLKSGTDQEKKAAKSALEASIRAGELGEQYGFSAEEIERYAESLKASGNFSKASDKALVELAKDQMRFDRAVISAGKNMKNWVQDLEAAKTTGTLTAETAQQMSEAYGDLLDIDGSQLSQEFLSSAKNLELMKQALEGNEEAYKQLQEAAGKEILAKIGIDTSQYEADLNAIMGMAATAEGAGLADVEAGASLDNAAFLQALTEMVNAAGMTAQQATDYLSSMGVDAEVVTEPSEPIEETVGYSLTPKIITKGGPYGFGMIEFSGVEYTKDPIKVSKQTTGQALKVTSASKSSGGNVKHSGSNPAQGATNSPKGGGGGGTKKAEPTKKSDVVERYKELEDQLDDVREEADRVKNSFDKLYGAEQEAAIERLLELEQQEISLMKQKAEEAKKFMQEDLDELMKVSAEVDVEFKVDEKGNLVNYTEEMTELYEELTKLETEAGDEWDKKEQEEIAALKEKISKLEEAIEAYEETRELLEDINAELEEMAGTPPLPLIKSELLDVYYEVEDQLDDIEEQIKDLEREAEGLTGEARLEVLQKIHELELERVRVLEKQAEIARQDMEDKKAAMEEIAERNDLLFEYDENGNITNYISQLDKLYESYEELYDLVTEDGLVSEEETAALDAMREDMEQMEEYAQGYRQAMETVEDVLNEIEDIGSGKASDEFVRSDYIDIYKETNDQLDDIDEKIDDLERQADKLTGEERIAKLKEIQKLEKERLKILAQQKEIAKQDIEDRKAALEELATLNGLLFDFDSNGNITNFDEQMSKLLDKYEAEYTKFLEDGVITETEQAILDAIDQDIQELNDAIDAYSDAVEQMEDIQNEIEDITESGYVDMDQLDDIGDKLHDINNTLDDIEDAINDASKAADRLYGEARIRQMNKTAQLIEKEIDALEKKKALQQEIIAEEKAELDEFSKGQVKYDSNGNITNYHEVIDSRKDAIREREAELKADGDFTETEAAEIQEMIDELERMEEEIEEYEQALEDQEDIENAIDDAYYEWQDLNAEQLSYKLELTLDVNDRELAKIERQISRLEGNFYTRAEALALMVGGGLGGSSKLGELNSQLSDLQGHYAEIKQWYAEGKISHEAYVSMTQEIQGEIEATAAEMEALQEQMDSYYKDTLAAARQELNFHISQIEHLTGILGHYKNILTTLGKSQDYEMMGTVLEGQVEALENEVQVAKRAMGMWQQEADEAYAKYQQALASGNQENADMYYQAYQEAINAANEAENKYYSKAQQWAQALKALMENTLAGLAQDLENVLTGGTSFETINTQLKRASSLQEEYLTTTNKIYETTKLMRTAQNEIDKTTNSVAKKKLANFITETKQMQNQNKLSKYELSIQQAKYDLLLAEIALEEARFAKSTVRLRRDSEGNFGYVYTADAEAVANAEQKFEDAQNKLYNIGLDGANKYTEKYQQTLSEMYNTLTQLQTKYLQGGFESEAEYNAAVSEAKAYYYEKLGQYSDLYSVALTTDSRVVADAWSTDFADMTQQTETWMNAVTDYLGQVRAAFAEWEQESDRIANETVGTNLETVKQKVAGIVSESDAMVTSINNSVIPAIQAEINEVQALTDQYAAMNGQMSMAIDNAYALSDAMQSDIDASVEKEIANMEAAEQEETQTQLDILTQQYNETLKAALEDNDISDEEQAQLDAIEREITALQNADSIIAEFEEAYKAAIADEVISDEEQEALNVIAQKLVDLKDEMAALEITNETLDALIAKIAEVESMEAFIEKYRTAYKAAVEDDNTISPAEQEGLNAIKEEIAKLRGFDEEATQQTNETLSIISEQLAAAQQEEAAQAQTLQGMLEELTTTYIGELILKVSDIYNSIVNASGMINEVSTEPASYDTGGYTGQWGPSGKWALLHEKELILNQGDTSNLLASLDLLDSILSTIDLHAMNSQFNSMINSPYIQGLGKETLEQMVTIEANFPNATDKLEIEEAFKDLVNLASQYANRK